MDWHSLFAICIWRLWKCRNDFIFNDGHNSSRDVLSTSTSWAPSLSSMAGDCQQVFISVEEKSWKPPKDDWVKLTADGSTNFVGEFKWRVDLWLCVESWSINNFSSRGAGNA
ncbi:hypothetical protein J1N35_043378 [Gossypium stocksii]|uniref:Uncharacterized protein n=1 Tax=Gossypium stocksii TaxID=47602 RepID=A0A9D3ZEY6_9ROSI|nr:hypothetical protein J1N35_043378 [Gossypium stocksii]